MFAKVLALALALTSVTAFAPVNSARRVASRTAPMMAEMSPSVPFMLMPKYTKDKDAAGMVGDVGFDPLGLAEFFDIKFLREAELKHGRVAMLAIVGIISQEFFHLPGEIYQDPNPITAVAKVGPGVMGQIVLFGGFVEAGIYNGNMQYMNMFDDKSRVPGDYGFDPLKLMKEGDPNEYALKEITHCRLAMIAVGGMIHQCFVTGTGMYGGHL